VPAASHTASHQNRVPTTVQQLGGTFPPQPKGCLKIPGRLFGLVPSPAMGHGCWWGYALSSRAPSSAPAHSSWQISGVLERPYTFCMTCCGPCQGRRRPLPVIISPCQPAATPTFWRFFSRNVSSSFTVRPPNCRCPPTQLFRCLGTLAVFLLSADEPSSLRWCSPTAISLLVLQMGRCSRRRCSMGAPDSAPRTTYQMNRCSSATPSCPADRLPEDMVTLPLRIVSASAFRHRRAASGPAASLLPPPGSFSNLWSQCCVVLFPCIEFHFLGSISFYIPGMLVFFVVSWLGFLCRICSLFSFQLSVSVLPVTWAGVVGNVGYKCCCHDETLYCYCVRSS
jgi:hypothetical protein